MQGMDASWVLLGPLKAVTASVLESNARHAVDAPDREKELLVHADERVNIGNRHAQHEFCARFGRSHPGNERIRY